MAEHIRQMALDIGKSTDFFRYGDEVIYYLRLLRKHTKPRVLIKVHPDGRVEAHAPVDASDTEVRDALRKRGRWISRQLREFSKYGGFVTPREYVSGETHFYLGRRYLLKVLSARPGHESVRLINGRFEVRVTKRSPARAQVALNTWYREHAASYFSLRVAHLARKLSWITAVPQITIRPMKRRWGSCSPTGHLTLNLYLIRAHRMCIDYVVIHELCHLVEKTHGVKFQQLLRQSMVNWESAKKALDYGASYWLGE